MRELVSNASDALEKLRHLQLTEKEIFDDRLELEINITTDDKAKTFTIQDFGVGMTQAELVENLGTIAHSGSKAFLKALGEGEAEGRRPDRPVRRRLLLAPSWWPRRVKVYTHSWRAAEPGPGVDERRRAAATRIEESRGAAPRAARSWSN